MIPNFGDAYKDYSTVDLLKIVQRSNDYQPAAVEAAQQILNSRTISEAELQEVDAYFQSIEDKKQQQKEKINMYKAKAADLFEPVLKPDQKFVPAKWLNILLLVICLQYLWVFYNTIRYFIGFMKCRHCSLDFFSFAGFISLVYIPVIFFLLYKKKRWGWILLFADNLIALILPMDVLFEPILYLDFSRITIVPPILPLIIRMAFVVFLWRIEIAGMFNVTYAIKKKTTIIAAVLALAFIVALHL